MTQTLPTTGDEVNGEQQPETMMVEQDLLVNMFMQQARHRVAYDEIYRAKGLVKPPQGQWGNINDPGVQAEIRELAGHTIEELYEAIGLLKNKPWKQTPRATDEEEFYRELGDAWHFWLELMIFAGMTPDLIAKYYFGESKKNEQRREEGY
jgi:hypothetical protein